MAYEFTEEQNKIILSLSKSVKFSGNAIFVIVGLFTVSFLFHFSQGQILYVVDLFILSLIALFHLRTATALKKIVHTEGSDIDHLMQAVKSFNAFYFLYYWAFILLIFSSILSYFVPK